MVDYNKGALQGEAPFLFNTFTNIWNTSYNVLIIF